MKPIRMATLAGTMIISMVVSMLLAQERSGLIKPAAIKPLDLPLISPEQVPDGVAYWLATDLADNTEAPYPGNILADLGLDTPLYQADAKNIVVDNRALGSVRDVLAALHLLAESARQTQGVVLMKDLDFPEDGEGGDGGTNSYVGQTFTTNDLWLEWTAGSVTNQTGELLLHVPAALSNEVWDLWYEPTFSANPDNWTWLTRTTTGQTNLSLTLPATQAYFRLGATNNDVDGDGMIDSWMSRNFGHVKAWSSDNTLTNSDYDSDGVNNLDEFLAGSDPNTLKFATHFTNLFVNQTTVSGNCEVQGGVPYQIAVLVDSTNLASATWTYYTSSNFTVTLPNADGNHDIRVALRGRNSDYPPVLDYTELTLDRVAPLIVITNPVSANATVTKPYLQLQGSANEPLSALSYDLTNATGLYTNLPVYVVDQVLDTNLFDFTTNFFQAYDLLLAANTNRITMRLTDRAGNTATTNFNVTLNYAGATNPVLKVMWPTNGLEVCGTNFTLRGWVDDEAATVYATVTSTNGDTNVIAGMVERSGVVWAENLPLNSGTNWLTLTATNAAGLANTTNLYVVKSSMTLTVTSIDGDLWQPPVTVYGTISASNYCVWVNGVKGTNYGNGTWMVTNVPVGIGGVASFEVNAIPPGGGDPAINYYVDKPSVIKITKHLLKQVLSGWAPDWAPTTTTWLKQYKQWRDDSGEFHDQGTASSYTTYPFGAYSGVDYAWSSVDWQGTAYSYNNYGGSTNTISDPLVTTVPDQQLDHLVTGGTGGIEAYYVTHYFAKGVRHEWPGPLGNTVLTVNARTEEKLFAGGKSGVGRESLYELESSGYSYGKPLGPTWDRTPNYDLPNSKTTIGGMPENADGKVWRVLAAGTVTDQTTGVAGEKDHSATPSKQGGYRLEILANDIPLNPDIVVSNAEFCVGQNVKFALSGLTNGIMATNYQWTLSGTYVNKRIPATDTNLSDIYTNDPALLTKPELKTNWWVSGSYSPSATYAASISCSLMFTNGNPSILFTKTGLFHMHKPKITFFQSHEPSAVITNGALLLTVPAGGIDVFVASDQDGLIGITQLMKGWATNGVPGYGADTANMWGLDHTEFYSLGGINPTGLLPVISGANASPTNNFAIVADEPDVTCFRRTELHWDFQDFIRFSPNTEESIFVTLGIGDWHIYATSLAGTNINYLIETNGYANPSYDAAATFPSWAGVVHPLH